MMKLDEYINNIESKLYNNFDIERHYTINGYQYDLFAEYHIRTERYILTRKTVIDAIEANEYCLIKYFDKIDEKKIERYIDLLIGSIDSLVNIDNGHMSSIITGVIILDKKPSTDIIEKIKRFKYHKGFVFGFKGWVDIRLILVTMNDEYIVANKKGREVMDIYKI